MKKLKLFLLAILLCTIYSVTAQVSITGDGSDPDGSAMLDVKSTEKGFLPPRMTEAQRNAINPPATGLLIYQTDVTPGYYYYTGSNWIAITSTGSGAISTSTCIDYDGNAYPICTIGTQVWMAENLRVTHYRDGYAIPNVTDVVTWMNLSSGAYCWYGNDESANERYGVLYNWYAVDDSRGLCPNGWHVPTNAEWTTFTTYLGGISVAGGKMKANSNLWNSPNTDATNSSNFSGLPGGILGAEGTFFDIGNHGFWWSSTEYLSSSVWDRLLYYNDDDVNVSYEGKHSGLSIRCLRDN